MFTFKDMASFLFPENMDFSSKCIGKDLEKLDNELDLFNKTVWILVIMFHFLQLLDISTVPKMFKIWFKNIYIYYSHTQLHGLSNSISNAEQLLLCFFPKGS